MIPRLQAEEAQTLATAVALGAGTMKRDDARRVGAALARQARGGGRSPAARRRPADPRALAAMGIKVTEVR